MPEKRREHRCVERSRPVRLEVRRGYARADHDAEIEPPGVHALRRIEEELDPGDAEDVGQLVRVAYRRRRSAREHGALEALGHEEGALEVHVRVDEAGDEMSATSVDRALSLQIRGADDNAVRDPHVPLAELAGEDVQPADVAENDVTGLQALRRAKPAADGVDERHAGRIAAYTRLREHNCLR